MIPNNPHVRIPKTSTRDDVHHEPVLNGPKRHHFVPRFYLKGFCRDELLSVYDRKMHEFKSQKCEATAVIGQFYTFEDAEGRKRYDIEKMFSEIESKAVNIIEKLSRKQEIDEQERIDFAMFVAAMAFRTPDQIQSTQSSHSDFILWITKCLFRNIEHAKHTIRSYPGNAGKSEEEIQKQAEEISDLIKNDDIQVTTDHQWAMATSLNMMKVIPAVLLDRNWIILHSDNPKRSFITSDSPVVLTTLMPRPNSFGGIGYANADALVMFPLTQNSAILMLDHGGKVIHLESNEDRMREFNRYIADRCQRFLYARDEALNRSLVDFLRLNEREWQPKITVS